MGTDAADVSLEREAAVSAAANGVLFAAEIAVVCVLADAVGVAGAGTYFLVVAAAGLAAMPVGGVGRVVRKRGSEAGAPTGEYVGLGLLVAVGYVALLGAAALTLRDPIGAVTPVTPEVVAPFVAVLGASVAHRLATTTYDALGRPGLSMWTQTVREVAFIGLLVASSATGGGGLTPLGAVWLRAGVLACLAASMFVAADVVPAVPSRRTARRAYAFGRWTVPRSLVRGGWGRLPTLVLGAVVGPAAVGLYEAAARLTRVASYFATCVNDPLVVVVSNETTRGGPDGERRSPDGADADRRTPPDRPAPAGRVPNATRVRDHVERAMGYTSLVAVPTVAVVAVLGGPLLETVYGAAFGAALPILAVLVVAKFVYTLDSPLSSAIAAADRPRPVFLADLGTVVGGLVLLVSLASTFGALGVAVAVLVVEVGRLVALEAVAARLFGGVVGSALLPVEVGAAAAGAAIAGLLRATVVPTRTPAGVAGLCLVLGIVYLVGVVGGRRVAVERTSVAS